MRNLEESGAEKGERRRGALTERWAGRGRGRERERERERERGGEIELCFRDSLFLARKKAQTRVACPPAPRPPGGEPEERRRREFGYGMETFCGQN